MNLRKIRYLFVLLIIALIPNTTIYALPIDDFSSLHTVGVMDPAPLSGSSGFDNANAIGTKRKLQIDKTAGVLLGSATWGVTTIPFNNIALLSSAGFKVTASAIWDGHSDNPTQVDPVGLTGSGPGGGFNLKPNGSEDRFRMLVYFDHGDSQNITIKVRAYAKGSNLEVESQKILIDDTNQNFMAFEFLFSSFNTVAGAGTMNFASIRALKLTVEGGLSSDITIKCFETSNGLGGICFPDPTPTATATATNTATITNTPLPPTATATRTNTPVPPTATATSTRTNTPVPPTATSTATRTNTPVPPTATATRTNTPVPPTATSTATRTNTPVPPTATATSTRTNTPVPPTATQTRTNTPVPPTATATNTATNTATSTATNTATITFTPSNTATATATYTPGICSTGQVAGDVNLDCCVDGKDLEIIRSNYGGRSGSIGGLTVRHGDLDGDGDVDGNDILIHQRSLTPNCQTPTPTPTQTPGFCPQNGLPGDANNDKIVDQTDYDIWNANSGKTNAKLSDGDFNGDKIVDAADYTIWRDNLGARCIDPASTPSPEPTGTVVPQATGTVGVECTPTDNAGRRVDLDQAAKRLERVIIRALGPVKSLAKKKNDAKLLKKTQKILDKAHLTQIANWKLSWIGPKVDNNCPQFASCASFDYGSIKKDYAANSVELKKLFDSALKLRGQVKKTYGADSLGKPKKEKDLIKLAGSEFENAQAQLNLVPESTKDCA